MDIDFLFGTVFFGSLILGISSEIPNYLKDLEDEQEKKGKRIVGILEQEIQIAMTKGDHKAALDIADRILALDPSNSTAKTTILQLQNLPPDVFINKLKEIVKENPNDRDAHQWLFVARKRSGVTDDTMRTFYQDMVDRYDSAVAHEFLALETDTHEQLIEELEKAISIRPLDPIYRETILRVDPPNRDQHFLTFWVLNGYEITPKPNSLGHERALAHLLISSHPLLGNDALDSLTNLESRLERPLSISQTLSRLDLSVYFRAVNRVEDSKRILNTVLEAETPIPRSLLMENLHIRNAALIQPLQAKIDDPQRFRDWLSAVIAIEELVSQKWNIPIPTTEEIIARRKYAAQQQPESSK